MERPKQKMSVEDRAKQFAPFAALIGFEDELRKKEHVVVPKISLSEEALEELDKQMHLIDAGDMVKLVYYKRDEYIEVIGKVSIIEPTARLIIVVNTAIEFDDIKSVEILKKFYASSSALLDVR